MLNSRPILDYLEEDKVLKVSYDEKTNTMHFTEQCDGWYSISLTKIEMYKLIEELKYLTDNMKDYTC